MLTGEGEAEVDLGNLEALSGVKQFPVRVKCATLAWKALESCLEQTK
ncbi:MAG: Fe-S cluster assembly sulfur transfer protein SufU, partial [bacterium]